MWRRTGGVEEHGAQFYLRDSALWKPFNVNRVSKNKKHDFVYGIQQYGKNGKILNANCSYYLIRTQSPILTDVRNRIYTMMLLDTNHKFQETAPSFVFQVYDTAIKNYFTVTVLKNPLNPQPANFKVKVNFLKPFPDDLFMLTLSRSFLTLAVSLVNTRLTIYSTRMVFS